MDLGGKVKTTDANMSRGSTLRDFAVERLTAAIEEIFELFEKTIAEYEEQLFSFKQENKQKQRLLDLLLKPKIQLEQVGSLRGPPSSRDSGTSLTQKITLTKSRDDKEENLSSPTHDKHTSTKTVPSLRLKHGQRQLSKKNQEEDINSESEYQSQTRNSSNTDDYCGDVDWEKPFPSGKCSKTENNRAMFGTKEKVHCPEPPSKTEISPNAAAVDNCNDYNKKEEVSGPEKTNKCTKTGGNDCKLAQIISLNVSALESPGEEKNGAMLGIDVRTEGHKPSSMQPEYCSDICDHEDGEPPKPVHMESDTEAGEKCKLPQSEYKENADNAKTKHKKHRCRICKLKFPCEKDLGVHKRVHAGDRHSKKTFSQRRNFDLHQKVHADKQPYKCSVCKKNFREKRELELHERKHRRDKTSRSSVGLNPFREKAGLDVHQRVKKETPYRCSICKKTFSSKYDFNLHKEAHLYDKPSRCPLCKKAFIHKGNLVQHLEEHPLAEPYICSICQKFFTEKTQLYLHLKVAHVYVQHANKNL